MKKIFTLLLSILMLFSYTATAKDYICTEVFYPIFVNGSKLDTGELPILNLNGSTYIPLRKIGEGSGLSVDWLADKQEVWIANTYKAYESISRLYALGIDILNETRTLNYLCGHAIDLCISVNSYINSNSSAKLIKYLTDYRNEFIPSQLEEVEYLITYYNTEYGADAWNETLNFNPLTCLHESQNAQQSLNIIIDAAIGYLNNVYTYQYYTDIWDTHYPEFEHYMDAAMKFNSEKYALKNKLYELKPIG